MTLVFASRLNVGFFGTTATGATGATGLGLGAAITGSAMAMGSRVIGFGAGLFEGQKTQSRMKKKQMPPARPATRGIVHSKPSRPLTGLEISAVTTVSGGLAWATRLFRGASAALGITPPVLVRGGA